MFRISYFVVRIYHFSRHHSNPIISEIARRTRSAYWIELAVPARDDAENQDQAHDGKNDTSEARQTESGACRFDKAAAAPAAGAAAPTGCKRQSAGIDNRTVLEAIGIRLGISVLQGQRNPAVPVVAAKRDFLPAVGRIDFIIFRRGRDIVGEIQGECDLFAGRQSRDFGSR